MPHPNFDNRPVLFICVGASNLARGYEYLTTQLRRELQPLPAEFLAALGPGRNYCARGGVLCISYSAIRDCGIFEAARERARCAARAVALVTDIGNDIMCDIPAETIVTRLDEIFAALGALGARIVATAIPAHLETGLSRAAFLCLRTLLYPKSRVTHAQAVAAIRRVNEFLKTAASHGINLVSDLDEYAGCDKIHYGIFKAHRAWDKIAGEMLKGATPPRATGNGPGEMMRSYASYMSRLIFMDLLPVQDKGAEFF